jgi:hypothetical protein
VKLHRIFEEVRGLDGVNPSVMQELSNSLKKKRK